MHDQKLIDDTLKKLTWDELQKNIMMDGDTIIYRRIDEVMNPEFIPHVRKTKFKG